MDVVQCLYPKVITNPYTGDKVSCGCGKCNACLNQRANLWVKRLDMEAECHKYVLFCTLTYADNDVPQVVRLRKDDSNSLAYIDSDTGELIDMQDVHYTFKQKDYDYIRETKVLDVVSKRDFQGFIKRLRSRFDYCKKGAKLRYYLCAEYGATTYRPHGHLLLFFDCEECARQIEVFLRESWSHGDVYDPHFVCGSASKYCAKYVNSLYSLPKCYLHKTVRPFALFSKNPAIGTLLPNLQDVRTIFETGQTDFTRLDLFKHEFVHEPFWKSFKDRLYPRLNRFGSLSHDDRVALYRLVLEFPSWFSAEEIARRIEREYITGRRQDTFFSRYFKEITSKPVRRFRFICDKQNPFAGLPFMPKDVIVPQNFTAFKLDAKQYCFTSLVAFVRKCLRLIHQAQVFGVSIDYYVSKIELFYESLDKQKRCEDYEFQNDYFKTNPLWHYIYFDKCFFDKVTKTEYDLLTIETKYTLQSLFDKIPLHSVKDSDGFEKTYLDVPPYNQFHAYINFKILHDKIAHDAVKQKKNNSYALAHKDKFGNIIKYQNT